MLPSYIDWSPTDQLLCRWSAIARGAALRGLDGALVHKKICRRHYGTTYDREFRDGVDSERLDDTYIHDFTGRKMVRGYMDWFFHKVGITLPLEAHAHRIYAGCRDISRNKDRDIMESL